MKLDRTCPFCGGEEVEIKFIGESTKQGMLTIVACKECGAAPEPVYCGINNPELAVIEWLEGSIFNAYVSKVRGRLR